YRLYVTAQGTSVALQGLSLDVKAGELLVVFGPSGSGKSTLLRILAGLDRPTAGSVRVVAHDLRTLRGRALLEYRSHTLGYADQPTGELDAENARELYALIRALVKERGATTVLVSHDPSAAEIADRVVQIRDGRVSAEDGAAVVNRGGWVRVPGLQEGARIRG